MIKKNSAAWVDQFLFGKHFFDNFVIAFDFNSDLYLL
jgi:hypothetical protein